MGAYKVYAYMYVEIVAFSDLDQNKEGGFNIIKVVNDMKLVITQTTPPIQTDCDCLKKLVMCCEAYLIISFCLT